jgi:hypothetical protein
METRLTRHFENSDSVEMYDIRHAGKEMLKNFKLSQIEDIEEKLGFSYKELVQMLIDGVYEVGGVDSKTMKPEPSCLLFYYVYGIDFENKCLKVMRATGYNERSIERSREFVFSSLHLCKYKKKCLGGWALTKKELLNE